ncbi:MULTISPECIES: DUF1214 domain-containing protein [Okeania]|uniref:DUF1254 domain-containing protein n=1 Tax=Okeania hirsuta TaxID=1458930 RepID=A0A3N6P0M5_9CYAN|nr:MULTISPECIES: DUF1214 domain-containing protein [Okeania]NET12757.1 DUF1254 domain-containing protein [Okeania sp. SIO1H6]NES79545.1 DUF1254 domain-containing protein [Okeania sp. SIO1H4]NES89343.1 DUF1254 domain-containing protein [Okeania sp. SIO2B9]NET23216.1 DUF1254 domain-containing protein [Okeania sp. SIO1H5]NET77958.1 DUF1254 domain-containing protein [Okeania sp. SIO1F9]
MAQPSDSPVPIKDITDIQWSQVPRRGLAYWERLANIISREPVQERDRLFMAMLKPLGIEKVGLDGTVTFAPDERQKAILEQGALVGEAMARVNDFQKRSEAAHYADGVHWEFALILDPSQGTEYYDQLDERAAWFYEAVTASSGMVIDEPGQGGQVYLGTYKDSDGNWLDGSNTYKMTVPANPPMEQFWSVTVYDNNARVFVDTDTEKPERSSKTDDLYENADGTVDIYVGPQEPTDPDKASN